MSQLIPIFNNNNITSTSMVTSTYGILNFKKGNVIVKYSSKKDENTGEMMTKSVKIK